MSFLCRDVEIRELEFIRCKTFIPTIKINQSKCFDDLRVKLISFTDFIC